MRRICVSCIRAGYSLAFPGGAYPVLLSGAVCVRPGTEMARAAQSAQAHGEYTQSQHIIDLVSHTHTRARA